MSKTSRWASFVAFVAFVGGCGDHLAVDYGYLATTGRSFTIAQEGAFKRALMASAVADAHCDGSSSPDVVVVVESSRLSVVDACGKRLTFLVDHGWTLVLASSTRLVHGTSLGND